LKIFAAGTGTEEQLPVKNEFKENSNSIIFFLLKLLNCDPSFLASNRISGGRKFSALLTNVTNVEYYVELVSFVLNQMLMLTGYHTVALLLMLF
jgi:hypothetical protein